MSDGANTRAVGALRGIEPPVDRWVAPAEGSIRDQLVHRSNLLGADRALANYGGGNTSAKETVVDHTGRQVRVLWVKGSGTDLATITVDGFPGLRLDDVLALRDRDAMSDADMVEYLRLTSIRPDQPRPSIETLVHAFVPATHVDHTHPDAVIALTANPSGRELAARAFGVEAVWCDYQRPGFALSQEIARLLDANKSARAVLLERHGLVTWGETSHEAYRTTLEFVTRAAAVIAEAGRGHFGLGGHVSAPVDSEACLVRMLPALRGALLADTGAVVLEVDRSPEAVAFASSVRAPQVSQIGAPCPDHLIVTKHKPLVVPIDSGLDVVDAVRAGVHDYSEWYREYYGRHVDDETRQYPIDSAGPRVIVVPGVGIVTAGTDARRARIARDLYHRAIAVENAADALGGFVSLTPAQAFAIEYWPLERYKLSLTPPPNELEGRVAVVTGGASGIGRATVRLLASRGAHVVIADRDADGAQQLADDIVAAHGIRRALAVAVDVTEEAAVEALMQRTILEYGGLDVLVASAGFATSARVVETTADDWDRSFAVLARGYFLAAREAFKALLPQGRGGSVVFVASKNALVAGESAAAYSAAKAASLHLARCLAEEGGPDGIRVNVVNPDAVIAGSSIWSSAWKAERASTYGIGEEALQDYYQARTKLGVVVLPEDVAEAIAFFAGPRSEKSTGNILNVDGGVTAAYPR